MTVTSPVGRLIEFSKIQTEANRYAFLRREASKRILKKVLTGK
jgi:hypothetical protein